jgi:hypothetical protein
MNKLYIIFLLLVFSNCKNETPQYSKNTTPLFDLKGFLDNEIATHLKDIKKVKKTVTVNGKTETKEVEIKDWKEELKPFFNSDINRPAWQDKYSIEKKEIDHYVYKTDYSANDKNLKTRFLSVLQNLSNFELKIYNDEKSIITNAESELIYSRKGGYQIITKQQLLGGMDSIKIEVMFM